MEVVVGAVLPDLAGSFPFDTVIAAILATQGNLHSTNFIRFLKCGRGRGRRAQGEIKTHRRQRFCAPPATRQRKSQRA